MLETGTRKKLTVSMMSDNHPHHELPAYYIIDGLLVYAHGGIYLCS